MALQSSGQISLNNIKNELNRPNLVNVSLDKARRGTGTAGGAETIDGTILSNYPIINTNSPQKPPSSGQVGIKSFYGYNHFASPDGTPPSTPTLSASPAWDNSAKTITLNWTTSTDNVSLLGYRLYYSFNSGAYQLANTLGLVNTQFLVGASAIPLGNGNYSWIVRALDSSYNESTNSNVISYVST